MTLDKMVQKGIKDLFGKLIEEVSQMEMTEDQAAGTTPAIFFAEQHLLQAWRNYLNNLPGDDCDCENMNLHHYPIWVCPNCGRETQADPTDTLPVNEYYDGDGNLISI